MKNNKFIVLVLLLLFISASQIMAKMPFAPDKTIGLHIGAKNPTFDESQFPDIEFYYTPEIKWAYGKASGTPEVLADWVNQKGLTMNQLVVFDKNGIADFTGFLVPGKSVKEVSDLGHLRTLEESLIRIVKEDRESMKKTDKPMKWDWVSELEGHTFPSFEVYNASGEANNIKEIIENDKTAKLMIIFHIPYNYKFQTIEEQMEGAENPMAVLGAITQMETGKQHTAYLEGIEKELYNR